MVRGRLTNPMLSYLVPVGGLEPPRPKATDFKSVNTQEGTKSANQGLWITYRYYRCRLQGFIWCSKKNTDRNRYDRCLL